MGRKVRVSIHACIRSSFLQSFYFFIHTTWGASDKTHLKAMSDEGTFERTEEMEKLIETRYTFVICFVGVCRRLEVELGNADFLKEQFKDLITPSGMHLCTLRGHTGMVQCLTAVGGKVYSGSFDETIRVWDTATHECISTLRGHTDYVRFLAIVGDKVYSSGADKTMRVWGTATHECISTLRGHTDYALCLTVVGDKMYYGFVDKTIRICT